MNQPNDAVAPTKPTASDGFHAFAIRRNSSLSRHMIHKNIAKVCVTMTTTRVKPACITTSGAGRLGASASEAER
ncbi:hypothetical protein D3C71_2009170 [compost metagenome]